MNIPLVILEYTLQLKDTKSFYTYRVEITNQTAKNSMPVEIAIYTDRVYYAETGKTHVVQRKEMGRAHFNKTPKAKTLLFLLRNLFKRKLIRFERDLDLKVVWYAK